MRLAAVLLLLAASSSLAQDTPPAQPQAPEAPSSAPSTLTVRCTEDCTVRLDGKAGLRKDTSTWEFKEVPPGQRRVEATSGILNRPLFNGYADVPSGMKVTARLSSGKRLTITERTPLSEQKDTGPTGIAPSTLNVRCPRACTVSMDGARKGAIQSQLIVVHDIAPGDHNVEVKFVLSNRAVRTILNIPAGSEVFATATESGLSITNSKPLAK